MKHGVTSRIRTLVSGLLLALTAACGGGGGGGGGSTGLAYTLPAFVQGVAFTDIAPSVTITPTGYTITSGTLPLGMSLNTTTGVISGFAAVATGPTSVTIEATDGTTTVSAVLSFTVGAPALSRFVLSTNAGDSTLSVLALDDASGMLRHAGYAPTGAVPRALALARGGSFVYTANNGPNTVSGFSFDTITGELTALAGSPFASSTNPIDICVDPAARFVYVLCDAGGGPVVRQYAMDAAGALTDLAPATVAAGTGASAIYMEPQGRFVYVTFGGAAGMVRPFVVNQTTGQLTAGTDAPAGNTPFAMAGTPDGDHLYVSNQASNDVAAYDIDDTTGNLTPIGAAVGVSGGTGPSGMQVTFSGSFLLVALNSGAVQRFAILGTGALSSLGTTVAPVGTDHVVSDHSNSFAFTSSSTAEVMAMYDLSGGGALTGQTVDVTHLRDNASDLEILAGMSAVTFASQFLYAGNAGDDDINQFVVNAANGSLTANMTPTVATGDMPNWGAAHPFHDAAYMVNANETTNAIEVFSIDGAGSLTSIQMVTQAGVSAWSLHVDPSGLYAFGVNSSTGNVNPYTIASDGMLTLNGAPFALGIVAPGGGAQHPNGKYLYVAQSLNDRVHQFAVNGTTGGLSSLSPSTVTAGDQPIACAVDPTGRFLYVACIGTADVISAYAIGSDDGELTELTASPFTTSAEPIDLKTDPDGRFLYVAVRGGSPAIETFSIDVDSSNATEDGALASTGTAALAANPFNIRVNSAGTVLWATHAVTSGMVETFAISPTGVLSSIDIDAAGDTTMGLGVKGALE